MNTEIQQNQNIPSMKISQSSEGSSFIQLSDIIHIIKRNWYWFILSITIALSIAFIYTKTTPKIYERQASVLIDDQKDMSSALSEMIQLTNFSNNNLNNKVCNEIVIFKTNRILSAVVDALNLRVSYFDNTTFIKQNLYRNTPFSLETSNLDKLVSGSLQVELLPEGALRLSEFKGEVKLIFNEKDEQIVLIGEEIKTDKGSLRFIAHPTLKQGVFRNKYLVKISSHEATVNHYKSSLSIEQIKGTSIINLKFKNQNTLLAEDFLNTLVKEHNLIEHDDRISIAQATDDFINNRIAVISQELGDVDTKIENFKKRNNIASISKEADIYVQGNNLIAQKLIEVNNQLEVAKFLKQHLIKLKGSRDLIPANVGLNDNSAISLIEKYNSLVLQREKLVSESSQDNPIVQTLSGQIKSMHKAVIKTVDNLILSLNIQLKSIEKQELLNKDRISSVPSQERAISSIYRSQKIKEGLYLLLLNARESNALKIESNSSNLRVIESATGSSAPITPKTRLILLSALILGIFIPAVILYIRILLNNMVRGRKDLEQYTTVPILGDIPHSRRFKKLKKVAFDSKKKRKAKTLERREQILNYSDSDRDIINEAFSVLRTNISFMTKSNNSHVIMTTSPIPGEGKTFVSANFGMSLSRLQEKKVVVLDLDIRKASLTDALRSELTGITQGATSYLAGTTSSIKEIIIPANERILFDFIPAGITPPNPSELLSTERFEQMIAELRELYDYILLDTAPFCLVADAQIISRSVDLTLMVVREGHLPRMLLNNIETAYQNKYFSNMALILNDVGALESVSGYSYGYSSYAKYGVYGEDE